MNETRLSGRYARDPLLCHRENKQELEIENLERLHTYVEAFWPESFLHDDDGSGTPRQVTPNVILEMHRLCIEGIYRCAGTFRAAHLHVQIPGNETFQASPHYLIRSRILDLCDYINSLPPKRPDLAPEASAIVMHRFTKIHPFAGGNGRVGRALVDLMLYRQGISLPGSHIGQEIEALRSRYIAGLRTADGGNMAPLAIVMSRAMLGLGAERAALRLKAWEGNLIAAGILKSPIEMPAEFGRILASDTRIQLEDLEFFDLIASMLDWQLDTLNALNL